MLQAAIDVAATSALGALLATGLALAWNVRRLLPLQLSGVIALAGAGVMAGITARCGPPVLVLAITILACLPIALLLDWLIDRPLRQRGQQDALLGSAAGLALLAGVAMHLLPPPAPIPLAAETLGIVTLLACLGLLTATIFITRYLKIGLAMRAVAFHADTAALMGINPDRILLYAVGLSAMLIATGGGLYTLRTPPATSLHLLHPIALGLTAAAIAGQKQLRAAALAGFILGGFDAVIYAYWPSGPALRHALPLVALLVAAFIRAPEPLTAHADAA